MQDGTGRRAEAKDVFILVPPSKTNAPADRLEFAGRKEGRRYILARDNHHDKGGICHTGFNRGRCRVRIALAIIRAALWGRCGRGPSEYGASSRFLPTLVGDLLDVIGRSYDGVDYVVLN